MGRLWVCSSERLVAVFAALTMKTIITSNWRSLRRVLFALLLGIAALWAMPRSARAQLYVLEGPPGPPNFSPTAPVNTTVGEYNAATGAVINATLITGIGLAQNSVAVSGNNLFLGNGGIPGTVSEYNATTGAVINANFITGVSEAQGLAL